VLKLITSDMLFSLVVIPYVLFIQFLAHPPEDISQRIRGSPVVPPGSLYPVWRAVLRT